MHGRQSSAEFEFCAGSLVTPLSCIIDEMAFTFPELRSELEVLGYGGVPDHVILSSLAQLNFGVIPSWTEKAETGRPVPAGPRGNPSNLDGQSPDFIDRDFRPPRRTPLSVGVGFNAASFAPDFRKERDEMRKTLKLMEGTREEVFGRLPRHPKRRMGLADEHEQYIGSLMQQWRIVARTLLLKQDSQSLAPADTNSSGGLQSGGGGVVQAKDRGAQESCSAAAAANSEIRNHGSTDQCTSLLAPLKFAEITGNMASPVPEGTEATARQHDDFDWGVPEGIAAERSRECSSGETEMCPPLVSKRPSDPRREEARPLGVNEGTSSTSPPSEDFGISHFDHEDELPSCQHEIASSPSILSSQQDVQSPQREGDTFTIRSSLRLAPALDDEHLQTHRRFNLQEGKSQTALANMESKAGKSLHQDTKLLHQNPSDSENPGALGVPAYRAPDRRVGGCQSPLNDRSNIRIGEDFHSAQRGGGKAAIQKIASFKSPVSLKHDSAAFLKRSRSTREASDNGGAANSDVSPISDLAWERLNSHIANEMRTPPSGRRGKSNRALQLSKSGSSPKIAQQSGGGAGDSSDVGMSSPSSSLAYNLQETASPLKLGSNSKRRSSDPASSMPGQRSCTCTVCPLSSRKTTGADSTRSPSGKSLDSIPRELEGSTKEKLASKKEVGSSPRSLQRIPLRKASKPSGIFTPLLDQKHNNVELKVLQRATQLRTPAEVSSESWRTADNQASSLGANAGNSPLPGHQRSPSFRRSKRNASADSSSFAKWSSHHTSSDHSQSSTSKPSLTPGGPRRGGRVDRVAR